MYRSDRRKYPRVDLGGEVNLLVAGVIRSGTLISMSPSGVHMQCRHQLVEQLNRIKSDDGLYPQLELELTLSDGRPLRALCSVQYCRRLSQDCYHLGFEFQSLTTVDAERVDRLIDHAAAA